jgi:autotransporter-associated beta strand protein
MGFSIFAGSVIRSGYLYAGVLSGVGQSNLGNTTGSYGSSLWNLSLASGSSTIWDLCFGASTCTTSLSSNITTGSGNLLSAVGGSLNPVFDGGIITMVNGDSSNQNFTVNSGGGTVSSTTGVSATLSGVFSGTGAMTYNGSGTTYMNAVNTYTGGTTVASGTLSVGSSEANNAARLAGDVTVQTTATLAGHGGIGGNVTNSGTVAPGGSIGTLTVSGNYVQNASGTLSTSITPTANSVLAVTGTASLAGGFAIDASIGTYTKKTYTVLTSSGRSGQFSGISGNLGSYSALGSSLSYDANNVYLILSASSVDTQQSLYNTSSELKGAFNLKNSIINNGLNYDCSLFDMHGLCISTGGRYTNTNTPTGDSTGALVIGGYRVNDNVRIGAYLDQGVASSLPTGIKLKQHNPLFGAFGVWQARQDGLGAQVKLAAGYNDSDMTVTRGLVGTSDAGSGNTSLTSQALSILGSYGVAMQGSWIASPYVGIRYTDVKAGGYTEASSSAVTAPLSYASLSQSTTSLLAGIRWSGKLTDRLFLNGSVGVEQDVSNNNSSYTATGVDGLTSIVFNTGTNKTRPVATIGTAVSIDNRQQLAFSVMYREEAFSKSSTTSAYGTYTIGF